MERPEQRGARPVEDEVARLLVGRPLRVVIAGMPLGDDVRPDRVNIVVEGRTIRDLWFG